MKNDLEIVSISYCDEYVMNDSLKFQQYISYIHHYILKRLIL